MEGRNAIGLALAALCAFADAQAAVDGAVIFARNQPATLCIEITGLLYNGKEEVAGRGSAFFLNDQRTALTDSHVIPDLNRYKSVRIVGKVRTDDAAPDLTVQLTLKSRDTVRDIALLEADAPVPSRYVVHGDSHKVRPGSQVIVIGCPVNFGPTLTTGHVGNTRDDPAGRWIFDAPINPGNSGGPVLTADGELVGIAWGGIRKTVDGVELHGLNYAIPIHQAVDGLLKEQSVRIYRAEEVALANLGGEIRSLGPFASGSLAFPGGARIPELVIQVPSANATNQPSAPKLISRAYEISEMKDDHPSVTPSTERRVLRFAADPGFRYTEYTFEELSRNHGSAPDIRISPDGGQITVSFSLTSGPLFDRYRGWLSGTLVTRQVRQ